MIQILEADIISKNVDEESGDIYCTAEVELMEPGALFGSEPRTDEIVNELNDKFNKALHHIEKLL